MRSGAIAGVCTATILTVLELAAGAPDLLALVVPWYGFLLGPLLSFLVLVPVLAFAGILLSGSARAWTGVSSAQLGQRWAEGWARMRAGSLAWHGWLMGTVLVLGGILAAGAGLQAGLDESFHHKALKGLLLTTLLVATGLVWTAWVRGALRCLHAVLGRVLPCRVGPWLLVALVVTLIGLTVLGAVLASRTLAAIGWMRVTLLLVVPLTLVASWVAAIFLGARASPAGWKLALIIGAALPASVLLGSVRVARQSVVGDSTASIVMSLFQHATDFDRDGASVLFGGGDCASFDPNIGPYAMDIPGNGLDENCAGGDASLRTPDNKRAFYPPPKQFPSKPDIILIALDALRADHTGFLGYHRNTTPELDKAVKSGVVFERAYSQASGTVGAMPSLFTSKFFDQIHYTDDRFPRTISPDENMLAERLRDAGYETVGISTIRYTHKGEWGLLQGFDRLDLELTHPDPAFKVTSPQVLSKGLEVLEKRSASSRPLFLWIHFYDIHSEYLDHPGQTSFGKERLDTYDGEILFTDGHVGRFLAALFAEKNRQQIVLLTADHGDGFQSDRGRLNHGYGLWNEQIHVPMVVWAPGAEPRRVDTPVSNLDIMATALNAAGIEARDVMGRSLFPYLYEGFRDPDRIVFAIEPYREGAVWHERSVAIGMRWRLHRFKRDGQQALHDFDSDPGEKVNLVRKQPAVADALGKELDDLVQQVDAYRLRYERAPDEPVRPNTR